MEGNIAGWSLRGFEEVVVIMGFSIMNRVYKIL